MHKHAHVHLDGEWVVFVAFYCLASAVGEAVEGKFTGEGKMIMRCLFKRHRVRRAPPPSCSVSKKMLGSPLRMAVLLATSQITLYVLFECSFLKEMHRLLHYGRVPSEGCGNLIKRATNCFTNGAL